VLQYFRELVNNFSLTSLSIKKIGDVGDISICRKQTSKESLSLIRMMVHPLNNAHKCRSFQFFFFLFEMTSHTLFTSSSRKSVSFITSRSLFHHILHCFKHLEDHIAGHRNVILNSC